MKCPACQTENASGVAFCNQCSTPLPSEPPPGQAWPQPGQQPPPPPPGAPGQQPPPGVQPSGEQYPPPAQQPAPGAYPAPGQLSSGQYPPVGQYPPPAPGQPSGEQHPPGAYPASGQPSGEQYPPGGQYPPPGAPGQPSGEQYPPGAYPAPGQPVSGEQPPGYPPPSGQFPPGGQPAPGAYGAGAPPGYGPPPAPPGYGPPTGPPNGPKQGQSGRLLLIVVAIVAVGAIVAALLLVPGGGDEESDQVVLEPVGSVQEDDFAGNLDVQNVTEGIDMALGGSAATEERSGTALASRVATGGEPGLYGGSRDAAVCDMEGLVGFLTDPANADKAEAWAGALGIAPSEIADYVGGLTAVRLRTDTRVTNHGFRDGEANPFQSLLQAGTAVLVDDQGVPRVKCNCGNPLAEPEPLGEGGAQSVEEAAQNPADAWEGMDPANVVTIQPAGEAVDGFVVVDPDDGALFQRPVGSNGDADEDPIDIGDACEQLEESPTCGGTGEEGLTLGSGAVQITLRWTSSADLDLHVTEPGGNEIYYGNRGPSASGGRLDKDSNVGCEIDGAVENVFWPEGSPAPPGSYTVEVNGYSVGDATCGDGNYTLTINVAGQPQRTESGSVAEDETDSYPLTIG